jgi:Zn-dependent peptidase ImmA (M78 family)/DNA-binding XRE family transcriptional regulator
MNVSGTESFTPTRLSLARERRGLTRLELAHKVGVHERNIRAYESSELRPSADTLHDIARALSFPLSFFSAAEIERFDLNAASFRALTKASAPLRNRVVAAGSLAIEFHRYLVERFDLPETDLPDARECTPEVAASTLRYEWGLGDKPIPNVIHLLEKHGVRVFSLSEDCNAIDAFSLWHAGTPFVFLNTRKTAERSIFDATHELGHLVLHQHGPQTGRDAERDADRFAAEFLMPEGGLRSSVPQNVTVHTLATMKAKWRVSVAALAHRIRELELISAWHYKGIAIELNRRGRENEPEPLPRETSAVLRKTLAVLAEEGVGLRDIARELHLPVAELQSLSFGLHLLEGGSGGGEPRGGLRLVT